MEENKEMKKEMGKEGREERKEKSGEGKEGKEMVEGKSKRWKELGKNNIIIKIVKKRRKKKKRRRKKKRLNVSVPHFQLFVFYLLKSNPGSFFINVKLKNNISHEALPRRAVQVSHGV